MKSILQFVPAPLFRLYLRIYWYIESLSNRRRSHQEIFTEIYDKKRWGHSDERPFFSGEGSVSPELAEPYIALISKYLSRLDFMPAVVDLGCGDFSIGKSLLPFCSRYIGVDVVPDLIEWLNKENKSDKTEFHCLDITKDQLPEGHVCLVRQVLQHLSNDDIKRVLAKLQIYSMVFITEHQPSDRIMTVPNKDMVASGRNRVVFNSGVYPDKPPFKDSFKNLAVVQEIQGAGMGRLFDPGIIRTYLASNSSNISIPL